MKQLKTREQVLQEFDERGESISAWARSNSLPRQIVCDLLHGRVKGRRGKAHTAAVLLGLKQGVLPVREATPRPASHEPSV
ncbi:MULTISPECIES: DNA-binding protein [unclassified Variovorax]|uniref:DNA-binding protein n=1 Tax=unclassified Variovorax TaxID=663243 RepID=UPI0034E8D77E